MKTLFTERLRKSREEQNLLQRQLASLLDMDTPLYSKIERGERIPKKDIVLKLAKYLKVEEEDLLADWLSDQISKIIKDEKLTKRIVDKSFQKLTSINKPLL